MKQMEFRSRIDGNGEIIVPEYIRAKLKKGVLVNVTVLDEEVETKDYRIFNMCRNYDERKRFWEQYDINGAWNGE
jgi:bifunctional DNA-binding transcriptional regulator/antitoxin component of YhaV-PrlF toxin-antitoxin module